MGLNTKLVTRFKQLAPGRHYAGSPESGCWAMIGRDVRDVDEWSIVPPFASLTLAWGQGGCTMHFDGGGFDVAPGECMWVDARFAHRGRNLPGSDFLTLFFSDDHTQAACLHLMPIGAGVRTAPAQISGLFLRLALLMMESEAPRAAQLPLIDAILDWVGTEFEPRTGSHSSTDPLLEAVEGNQEADIPLGDLAGRFGLTPSGLSRKFKARHHLSPQEFRKQLRLADATRALANGATVTAAAYLSGFADGAHLTRSFRKQYAIAPSTWARRIARKG